MVQIAPHRARADDRVTLLSRMCIDCVSDLYLECRPGWDDKHDGYVCGDADPRPNGCSPLETGIVVP